MDSESNTYVDDGSTASKGASAGTHFTVKVDGSQAVISSEVIKDEPDFHGSQAAILKEVISADCKGEMYQSFLDSENNTCLVDVSTTADEILLVADSRGSPAVKSKAGEGALNTVPHYFGSRTNADEGRPYLHFERVIFGDDGPTTKESISLCNDLSVSPTVIPTSGKGEPYQRTDMDSESNTCCCDGLATEKGISFFSDIVSQAVKPMYGEEAHLVGGNMVVEAVISKAGEGDFLDSERDTCRYDGLATKEAMAGEAQRAYMESLPSDIVQDILSRVPAESVLDCKLVCKRWETFIRSRNFANMHLRRLLNHLDGGEDGNHYLAANVESSLFFACRFDESKTLLYHGGQVSDRISIGEKYIYNQNLKRIYHAPMHTDLLARHFVGSCNGLVCTYQLHNEILDPIYICNPLTREYVYLPQLVVNKEDVDHLLKIDGEASMYYEMACGFGYARSTKEYKVVRIHYLDYNEGTVEVYTLGSGCGWRAVGKVPRRLNLTRRGTGTYANDSLYWISMNHEVVAFDLADEKFWILSVPPCLQNRKVKERCGLVALGRHLCLYMDYNVRVEIWSVMISSDLHTWTMEFDINFEAVVGTRKRLEPILLTNNGEIVFLYAASVLYSYDPKTTIFKMISNEASDYFFRDVEAIAHLNTIEATGENSKIFRFRPRLVRTPWDDIVDELDRVALGEEIDTTRYRLGSSSI